MGVEASTPPAALSSSAWATILEDATATAAAAPAAAEPETGLQQKAVAVR
jgi:hypothetical protein